MDTTRNTLLGVVALLVAGAALPAGVRADVFSATLGEPLREVSHAVDVHLRDGVATLVVHRTFANAGRRHDEAGLLVELPPGAAATGLRIRGRDRWYDGELMDAERAAQLYEELTGIGPHSPRDPALLWWQWPDEVMLQVFPIAPGGASTAEYTLTVPTRYADGRYLVPYPYATEGLAPPVVRVFPETTGAEVRMDGRIAAREEPVVLLPPDDGPCPTPPDDEPLATCAVSVVTVEGSAADRVVSDARVRVDVRHTYRGDLTIWLVAPDGAWHELLDGGGSSDNDVRETFAVAFDEPVPARGDWRLVVADQVPRDAGTLDGWTLTLDPDGAPMSADGADTPRFIPDAPDEDGAGAGLARIEVGPPPIDTLRARFDRLVVTEGEGGKSFARLEWDAAPQLRPLPQAPSVVFVVDASHSAGPDLIRAQLELAQAYLTHVPDAAVEVVAFRRHAERVFGRFEPRAAVEQLLARGGDEGPLPPGNGSALDEGLRLAAAALHGRPAPRRIVALSDALLRSRWDTAEDGLPALADLDDDTIVHVVLPALGSEGGRPEDRRDDDHDLSPLADRHGGVLLRVDDIPPAAAAALAPVALGLVRPVRIDGFAVDGLDVDTPDTVAEGSGFRSFEAVAAPPREVTLRGRVWAQRFERTVAAPSETERATAAFVFSHDVFGDLTDDEQRAVAYAGGAVSPVTSYLAIEPGVRPSRAGIDRSLAGLGAGAASAAGVVVGTMSVSERPDLARLLRPGVERCIATHRPAEGWSLALSVETTRQEVVDVVTPGTGPLADCVVEAAWALRLSGAFTQQRASWDLLLP